MKTELEIPKFWDSFLQIDPNYSGSQYSVWSFGDTPNTSDYLGELVRTGQKTATCSLLWAYKAESAESPKIGDLSIIVNSQSRPLCLIQTSEVNIRAYNEVDESFAFDEYEGDRSLAYWRQVHWDFFSQECERFKRKPNLSMPLVCERFKLLFANS